MNNFTPDMSGFHHAAVCLSQAASSLSVAAQAMAEAADALCAIIPQDHSMKLDVAAPAEESTPLEPNNTTKDRPVTPGMESLSGAGTEGMYQPNTDEGGKNHGAVDDDDYYMSDHDEDYIYALLKRQQEEMIEQEDLVSVGSPVPNQSTSLQAPKSVPLSATSSSRTLDTEAPYYRKRILVQNEADILATVCALSQRFRKVLCYMQYPMSSLTLYQKIIKDVTEGIVYSMTPQSPDWILSTFDDQDRAIMLLHETSGADLSVKTADQCCIIHAGWPCNADRYKAQAPLQDTWNLFLVACAKDQNIYPACSEIMQRTTPWLDQGILSLENLVTALHPRLHRSLSSIAQSIKETSYMEWIESHSRGGQHYVSSWNSSTLVKRANGYLLEMLQYKSNQSDTHEGFTGAQRLPQVSSHFAKKHGLEQAVQEGVLQITTESSGPGRVSELSIGRTEVKNLRGSSTKRLKGNAGSATTSVSLPVKYSYILRNESDTLPVACALAEAYDKAILGTTTSEVIILGVNANEANQAINEFNAKQRAIMISCEDSISVLEKASFPASSCIIHVGWPSNYSSYLSQSNCRNSRAATLVVFLQDVDIFPYGLEALGRATPYPSRAEFESTKLPSIRAVVESLLAKEPNNSKEQLYKEWIENHGPHGRRRIMSWSPVTLALRANDYLLNVLKYHSDASGSVDAINTLPSLEAIFVERHRLQEAVDAGILNLVTVKRANYQTSTLSASSPTSNVVNQALPATKAGVKQVPAVVKSKFNPTWSILREYMVHGHEFNIIPSICRISRHGEYKNTICFVRDVCVYAALSSMISEVADKSVFVVVYPSPELTSAIVQALASPKGCIVFSSGLVPLAEQLQQKEFTQSIHVGWMGIISYNQHINIPSLSHSYIMFSTSQLASVQAIINQLKVDGVREYPYPHRGLEIYNEKWKLQLASASLKTLRRCYMEWIVCYHSGSQKIAHWTEVDVVAHANNFARNVLLRGMGNNGSRDHTMIGGPLSVTPGFVKQWRLQSAVAAKVLHVDYVTSG